MKSVVLAVLVLMAAFVTSPLEAAAQTRADLEMRQLDVAGQSRSFGIYQPQRFAAGAPLIIALHGRFSSAKALHAMSGMAALAEARGALLVYPQSIGGFWNEGGHAALGRQEAPHDDAAFVAAIIEAMRASHGIDPHRVYLVGYDVGGGLVFNLSCAGEMRVAGAAVVSALMWSFQAEACGAGRPTPMLIVHGRRDEYYPVRGARAPGASGEARRLSAEDTLTLWRRYNNCQSIQTRVGESQVHACAAAALAYVSVPGGAHEWFRTGPQYQVNRPTVDSTALLDAFFFTPQDFVAPRTRGGVRPPRAYIAYAPPSYNASRPAALVVLLHGRPSNAASMAQITQMNAVAAANGFIVAYPDGLDNEWNNEIELSGGSSRRHQDDVLFLETLVGDLSADFNIDQSRVYLGGFSNGAFMVHRMRCSSSGPYAAYAAVGAAMYSAMREDCTRGRRAPVLIMHGTGDPSIPYTGVIFGGRTLTTDGLGVEPTRVTVSVPETVEFFIQRNGCELLGLSTQLPERGQSPGTNVVRFAPYGCDGGADVVFYLVNGGGHTWPGEIHMPAESFGPTNMDFKASEAIWEFFAGHSRDRQQ